MGARPGTDTSARWRVVLAALAVAALLGVEGCASSDVVSPAGAVSGGALVVVTGGHANMPFAGLTGQAAQARDLAAAQGARVTVVVADGAPYVARELDLRGGGDRLAPDRAEVDAAVAAARARTSESDLVAALTLAGEHLGTGPGLRAVVVADSGLSTSGAVDFTRPGMLDAIPAEVAGNLVDLGRLPRLAGAVVVFQGLGDTGPPQQPLDDVGRSQVQGIWMQVARQAGAVDVRLDSSVGGRPSPARLPAMSKVAFGAPLDCSGNRIRLAGSPTAFQPLSPDFVDADAAATTLRPVADRIRAGGLVAEVFGRYPAVGERSLRQQLSEQRAQAVANVLIALGVPVSQLRVKGLGSDFPEYLPDRDVQGHLVPSVAALNRLVTIDLSKDGAAATCR